jgi:hypothetical protein
VSISASRTLTWRFALVKQVKVSPSLMPTTLQLISSAAANGATNMKQRPAAIKALRIDVSPADWRI